MAKRVKPDLAVLAGPVPRQDGAVGLSLFVRLHGTSYPWKSYSVHVNPQHRGAWEATFLELGRLRFYRVTRGHCTCRGFKLKKRCKHLWAALELVRTEVTTV